MNKHTHNAINYARQRLQQQKKAEHSTASLKRNDTHRAHYYPDTERHGWRPAAPAKVAIVGLGYVGLPLALLARTRGYDVIGVDIDQDLVSSITTGEGPNFISDEEKAILSRQRIKAYTNAAAVAGAQTIVICVPTPVNGDHTPDLRPLISAATSIAPHIAEGSLVVIESTVSPGVCEDIVLPILENHSGLRRELTLFFAHCPERINPGDPVWNVRTIPRVVGGVGPKSLKKAVAFYEGMVEGGVKAMASIQEAEAVKMVENSYRDINIAFVNELAMSFQKLGIDVVNVLDGASTKPFGFTAHYPGCGVGGHCIPVDPYYLIEHAKKNGFDHRFLKVARTVNNGMPEYAINLLEAELEKNDSSLVGAQIALLGLAYKRDIGDTRESPALHMRDLLKERGSTVRAYDPHVPQLSNITSLTEALTGATAVIIATDHADFRTVTPEMLIEHDIALLVDGRNCLDKKRFIDAGIRYLGIGR